MTKPSHTWAYGGHSCSKHCKCTIFPMWMVSYVMRVSGLGWGTLWVAYGTGVGRDRQSRCETHRISSLKIYCSILFLKNVPEWVLLGTQGQVAPWGVSQLIILEGERQVTCPYLNHPKEDQSPYYVPWNCPYTVCWIMDINIRRKETKNSFA